MDELRTRLIERLGRRGTIAVGIGLTAIFLLIGGPLLLAGASGTVIGAVVFAAILVGPALWVLADARRRGIQRPFLWAIFALLGNVIGAIVYVLVRDEQPAQHACTACGRPVSREHSGCPWCGTQQAASKSRRTCGHCHSELELDWRFCPYCRHEQERVREGRVSA